MNIPDLSSPEFIATVCFALAILHIFSVKQIIKLSHRYPEGSFGENFFHLLGEIEVVFGIWAAIFITYLVFHDGASAAIQYLETRNFTEPAFVFVIMVVCATKPILVVAEQAIKAISRLLPFNKPTAFYVTCLTVGPIIGSFITEPAAMTVTALILYDRFYTKKMSSKFMYATLGLLFVNISIGGTLTPFAAPPVLMVAAKWQWDIHFMLANFGYKAAMACTTSTAIIAYMFRKELSAVAWTSASTNKIPFWVSLVHLIFLTFIVLGAHHIVVFAGLFLFFLGFLTAAKEYQDALRLREGLLVAFFLGGLVIIGGPQKWWLEPILTQLDTLTLFIGSMGLTAIVDNAALTYLGSQVPTLSDAAKYALVAGSVVGGGLTVIANAPNPAGFGILNPAFGEDGISPVSLFKSALLPTAIAAVCFWLL